jgi:hypothetical protein
MGKPSSAIALLAVLAATGARANLVRERTEPELLESADLVVDARIVATGIRVHLPPSRVFTDDHGVLNVSTGVRKPCLRAAVERIIKGRSGRTIILCSSLIAEGPRLPRRGQFVRLYLQRDGAVWGQVFGGRFRPLGG